VKVDGAGKSAGGDSGKPSDDPDDEALRARDADGAEHSFRVALEAVVEGPKQPQEVERPAEWGNVVCLIGGIRAAYRGTAAAPRETSFHRDDVRTAGPNGERDSR